MSSQLYAAKKPCNKCGGLISWDVGIRQYLGTKLPLNLDKTIHDKASCELVKEEHPGLPTEPLPRPERQPQPQSQPQQQEERRNAIQQAHDENMQSGEKLRQTIQALIDKLTDIEKQMIIANEIVKIKRYD